ncbi:MAG: hypothetical protein J6S48_03545 [Bacteroidales bacterium]|nr:hypothetical protein [Bacteroidales bacterium]
MKKTLLLFCPLFIALLLTSCRGKRDKVLAEVYYHRLYESELRQNMPTGLSPADSIALANDFIDNWLKEKILLHEAERKLSLRDKNFDKKIEEYRNTLLINRYYDMLTANADTFQISDKELDDFMKGFDNRYTIEKEIVKVNYVKLSKGSPLLPVAKGILFDDNRRAEERDALITLLGDSIEYLMDDNTWFYLDDIQNEVSFDFSEDAAKRKYVEREIGDYHYLMVILDYKNQRSVSETEEERAAARMMLLNQRKQQLIREHVDKLYEEALKNGEITQ